MKKTLILILIAGLISNCGNSKKPSTSAAFEDKSPFSDEDLKQLDELTQASETNPEAPNEQQTGVSDLLDLLGPLESDALKNSQVHELLASWKEKLDKQEGTIKMLNFLLLILHLAKGSKEKCYQQAIAEGKKGIMKKLKACAQSDFSQALLNPQIIHQLIGLTQKTPADPAATQRLMDPLQGGGMNYPSQQ